jgi:tetratricopeptide (TPR) repeat protein
MRLIPATLAAAILAAMVCLLPAQAWAAADDSDSESYIELWQRGEYQHALMMLSRELEGLRLDVWPVDEAVDHAELLFSVGRVDEAIREMESVVRRYPEPAWSVTLALYYRERGRLEDFQRLLREATIQIQRANYYSPAWKNALAVARLLELGGQNPKDILNSYIKIWIDRMPDASAPYVAAGDLAYRKYSYDVAAEYYGKALQIDPRQQDALTGLAECYWKSEDPRAEETLKALLALNPHHPRARAIQVRQLLDLGRAKEALAPIQAALAINPNDIRFLGLLAAARFMLDDAQAVSATLQRALAFNPHGADAFITPAAIASRHYRFTEAAAMLRQALQVDKTNHDAQTELAFNLLRLGQEGEARTLLDQAFQDDPYNVHVYNMLQVLDSLAKFKTIRDGAFQIQLPEQDARLLGGEMLATLKAAIARYQTKYDVRLTRPWWSRCSTITTSSWSARSASPATRDTWGSVSGGC